MAQAAEWQCKDLVELLIGKVRPELKNVSHSVALAFLRVSSVHAASTQSEEWAKLLTMCAARVAETCAGDLDSLLPCSFEAVSRVLACNQLDTKEKEGGVLQFVAKWALTHGNTELAKLLELVRFPLLHLTSLDAGEKEALRYFSENAGVQLQRLIGEAILLQTGRKRPREGTEDAEAYERRAKKRVGSGSIPTLSEEELGLVTCGDCGEQNGQ